MFTVAIRKRRSDSYLRDKRFAAGILVFLLVMLAGPMLASVIGLPAWVKPLIFWGFPWAWLLSMAFIPILGDDGVRHSSIVISRSRTDR